MTEVPLPAPPQVVILAGGRGSRLGPLTARTPKVLLPVGGRPFLALQLAHLRSQGVTRVHLCLSFGAEQVLGFLDDRSADGMEVTTSVERTLQGTAGCLRLARPQLDDEFAVLVGDSYLPVDLRRLASAYHQRRTDAAMVVLRNHDRLVPSNAQVQDGLVTRYEKGLPPGTFEHVDYGIAFLRRASLARIPGTGPADLSALFRSLIARRQLAALEVSQRFYEIGSPAGYAELCDHLPANRGTRVSGAAP